MSQSQPQGQQRPGSPPPRVHSFRDDALGSSDTVDLLARLRAGEVSAQEVAAAALSRARDLDDAVNAVVCWVDDPTPDPERADAPLWGVPTFVKDNEALAGLPTRDGSRATSDRVQRSSSPWVQQYLDLGAVPLGKSTLPEFGLTSTTESSLTGVTRNPWHLGRSTGGSSGGAAALVAAGVVPMAHANDGGGSIRIPASCCGLVGLKPSRHRIVDVPEYDRLPVNLPVQGVVTRSVRDTALYLAVAEQRYRHPSLPSVGHVTEPGRERLRIGVLLEGHSGQHPAPGTVVVVRAVAELLSWLGHDVVDLQPPWGRQFAVDFLRYWAFTAYGLKRWGGAIYGQPFRSDRTEVLTDELARYFRATAERLPGSLRRLRRFGREYDAMFDSCDLVLSPVLADEPPPIGYLGPDVPGRTQLVRLLQLMFLTPLANVAGAPAVSLPLGMSDSGVPIGVHLAARVGQERRLLEVALELEEARPFARLDDPAAAARGI